MTTLAAVFGALPIALGYGADGSSRRPLGLVVVGGLVVSQFITLYITPVIYLYLEQFQEKVLDRTSFLVRAADLNFRPASRNPRASGFLLIWLRGIEANHRAEFNFKHQHFFVNRSGQTYNRRNDSRCGSH